MSGTFADIPEHRMKLDSDGTVALFLPGPTSPLVDITSALAALQNVDGVAAYTSASINSGVSGYISLLFPEARTVKGVFWALEQNNGANAYAPTRVEYSTDTIDGVNGTWTTLGNVGFFSTASLPTIYPNYRSGIGAVNVANVKGLRFVGAPTSNGAVYLRTLHVYGSRPIASIDRLAFWHPTTDAEISGAALDWGDVPRANITGTRSFRIKNLSATKTATTLQVAVQNLTGSPFGTPGLQVSTDGGTTWLSTTPSLGSLAPGAISATIMARLSTDSSLVTQARSARLVTTYGGYA